LPIVLAILVIGSLVIGPFLNHAGTNLMASNSYQEIINETYAGEAGVEQAIWQLEYGTLATHIPNPGNSTSYTLTEAINNLHPDVTVTLSTSESGGNGNHNGNGGKGNYNGNGGNGNHYGNTDKNLIQTYLIQSVAGNTTITANVELSSGTPSINSWSVDRG
jgi:hypothetical protein